MSYYAGPTVMAATGSNGSTTHGAVNSDPDSRMECFHFVVEAVGGTPTITFKVQGSLDGTNWTDIPYITGSSDTAATTGITVTATGVTPIWLANADARFYKQFRLVTSANTNVTYRCELYEVPGSDAG